MVFFILYVFSKLTTVECVCVYDPIKSSLKFKNTFMIHQMIEDSQKAELGMIVLSRKSPTCLTHTC